MAVTFRREGATAFVMLDNPPVNAIGIAVRDGLDRALHWVSSEAGLDRVILMAAGPTFAAGGDAREFDADPMPPHLPDICNRIEDSFVPWIAAIQGAAMGGGLELALACRYRIAAPGAVLGLPEVMLGVVPGAGGTQRLPRLVGVAKALAWVPSGKGITAVDAKAARLIDELDDDPVDAAEMMNTEWLGMAVPVGELNTGNVSDDEFTQARAIAEKKMRGQTAPLRAIDLIETATKVPLAEGLAAERATFLDLRSGVQSRALRHLFFAERGARAPKEVSGTHPAPLEHVAVVGGGTMGAGIASACLNAGLEVTLLETDADGAARARSNVVRIVDAARERGLIDAATAEHRYARLTTTEDYGRVRAATLAIEAAFESMDVKRAIFAKLDDALSPDAVLATNTSYLDINEIAKSTRDPARVVGLHFFAPAHIMKLLEIVRGDASSPRALATGYDLARRLRKIPVLSGVCDGFIGNRILARYREAADTLLIDGTNPWELDEAMVAFGYAMGPYEAQDLSGLDIAHANRRRQDATRDPNRRYVPISDRMVAEGRLGKKTGVGWYRYPGGGGKVVDPLVEDLVREEAHFAGVRRSEYTSEVIQQRLLLAMINEAASILDDGIAACPSDIDLVTVAGYGFPRWRGGLMHYADTLGPKRILDDLQSLAAEDPVVWSVSPLIERLASDGRAFADLNGTK
ncbi:MAG: 3-hydroxyacyl-CoA dehydrogenase NAD-binding domain-containing protein [Pseudomonadota bacterium]